MSMAAIVFEELLSEEVAGIAVAGGGRRAVKRLLAREAEHLSRGTGRLATMWVGIGWGIRMETRLVM